MNMILLPEGVGFGGSPFIKRLKWYWLLEWVMVKPAVTHWTLSCSLKGLDAAHSPYFAYHPFPPLVFSLSLSLPLTICNHRTTALFTTPCTCTPGELTAYMTLQFKPNKKKTTTISDPYFTLMKKITATFDISSWQNTHFADICINSLSLPGKLTKNIMTHLLHRSVYIYFIFLSIGACKKRSLERECAFHLNYK